MNFGFNSDGREQIRSDGSERLLSDGSEQLRSDGSEQTINDGSEIVPYPLTGIISYDSHGIPYPPSPEINNNDVPSIKEERLEDLFEMPDSFYAKLDELIRLEGDENDNRKRKFKNDDENNNNNNNKTMMENINMETTEGLLSGISSLMKRIVNPSGKVSNRVKELIDNSSESEAIKTSLKIMTFMLYKAAFGKKVECHPLAKSQRGELDIRNGTAYTGTPPKNRSSLKDSQHYLVPKHMCGSMQNVHSACFWWSSYTPVLPSYPSQHAEENRKLLESKKRPRLASIQHCAMDEIPQLKFE